MTNLEESDWLKQVSPSLRRAHRAARWLFRWMAKSHACAYRAYYSCPAVDDPDQSSEERAKAEEECLRYTNPVVRLFIRGRDVVPRATRSIVSMLDEFGAASQGVFLHGDTFAARSLHELSVTCARFWLDEYMRGIAAAKNGECYPLNVPDNQIDTVTETDIRKYVDSGIAWIIGGIDPPPDKSDLADYLREMTNELGAANQLRMERQRQSEAARGRLSEAEERIVETVQQAGKRLTTQMILGELEQRYGVASQGTTKVCLANLVRRRYLTNRQDVIPKGYGLPEWE